MPRTPSHVIPVTLMLALAPATRAYDLTNWTGAANNGLWADPLNWSNGLPTSTGAADLARASGTVDLGAATRQVDSLSLGSIYTRLTNGTLVLNRLDYGGFGTASQVATVATNLTTRSPSLWLNAVNATPRLRVEGPIVGDNFELRLSDVALAGASTYTGRTVVGVLFGDAAIVDDGSARHTASVDVGTTLLLDNYNAAAPDRLNDAAPVRLVGGQLQLRGNPNAPTSETVGPLRFDDGGGTVTVQATRASSTSPYPAVTLRAASMERTSPAGVVRLVADPAAGQKMLLDTAPVAIGDASGTVPTARPVIPWIIAQPNTGAALSLVTYDPDAGLRPLDPDTEFSPTLPAGSPAVAPNVRLTTPQTAAADTTVNALIGTLALDRADLTVRSGALMNATVTGTGAVRAPAELVAYNSTLAVPVHARTLTLVGSTTLDAAVVDAPDGIVVTAGDFRQRLDLTLRHGADLGPAPIRFVNAGSVTFDASRTIPNDIALGIPAYALTEGHWLLSSADPALRLNIPTGQTVTLTGKLSGHVAALDLRGALRIDGTAIFDSFYAGGPAAAVLELNGTLGPEDDRFTFTRQAIQVAGRLGGDGTLLGVVSGTITPGRVDRPGRLTVDSTSVTNLTVDLDGPTPAAGYDQLVVLTSVGNLDKLTVDLTFTPATGQSFLILDNRSAAPITDTFTALPEGATLLTPNNTLLQISYTAGDGNDISLTTVPEPTTILPLAASALTLLPRPRRQRKVPG